MVAAADPWDILSLGDRGIVIRRERRMNAIICGAGRVGSHIAEVLATMGHNITIVDSQPGRLHAIGESHDVGTLAGNCATAEVLLEAGAPTADLLIATTQSDEINLLTASTGRALGVRKCICRVHHSTYFEQRGLDYRRHLGIDHLICPDFSTAQAIASLLLNPGAQEFKVGGGAPAVGKKLHEVPLPTGLRLALLTRNGSPIIPDAGTVIESDDAIVLVGNADVFMAGLRQFGFAETRRLHLAIMGGSPTAVWLCRALQNTSVSIRLFETRRQRAEELAAKLEWVTVLRADPTEPIVFDDEHLEQADAFAGLAPDNDEENIISAAWAKSHGIKLAIVVVQNKGYMRLLQPIGIDYAFTPPVIASQEILGLIDPRPLHAMATMAGGIINVYRAKVKPGSALAGRRLRDLGLSPGWIIAAIEHNGTARVPGPDDVPHGGDTLLVIGMEGREDMLAALLAAE
jgi:trk system potassium uptake protein TrkA